MQHLGEIYGLITAIFWTATSVSFEIASKKFGSLTVNLIRLTLAFVLLSVFCYFTRGLFFPSDASLHNWIWLALSGIVGFVIGDFMLFKAYSIIGARVSQVVMALSPAVAALSGWIIMGKFMSLLAFIGMTITTAGIIIVILTRHKDENGSKKIKMKYPIAGILFAFGGAVGQGVGLVLSKYGMQDYNAFAASQIRVLTGAVGFGFIFLIGNRWHRIKETVHAKKESLALIIGTFFGPFLGVSFSLLSVQKTSPGIAQTLMSIVPIIIIPFSHFMFKEKITLKEIIGAIISFIGITLFFI